MRNKRKELREIRKAVYAERIADFLRKGAFPRKFDNSIAAGNISLHYSYYETDKSLVKLYMIREWPVYIDTSFLDRFRRIAMQYDVVLNYYVFGAPHTINWDSPEMKNKRQVWERLSQNKADMSTFKFMTNYQQYKEQQMLIKTTEYLTEAQLIQRRTTCKCNFILQLIAQKDKRALERATMAVSELLSEAKGMEIDIMPIKGNLAAWIEYFSPFNNKMSKNTTGAIISKVMTDDNIAMFNGFKQGRIGDKGIPIGEDVRRLEQVLWQFKSDPEKLENWLITAESGGGKSVFVKNILFWLLCVGFTETIMDYEGDEYTGYVETVQRANPDWACTISMNSGSSYYVDPMELPQLTGEESIDATLKAQACEYARSMLRIAAYGVDGKLDLWDEYVLDLAIGRVFESHGVTEDKSTWCRSKGARLSEVYDEIKRIVRVKELYDDSEDCIKHKKANYIMTALAPYFEATGVKNGAFKHALSLEEVFNCKLIVFSFGQKGATASTGDEKLLALKQLSVANLSTQISNYSKYVNHCFNVKVWEEFQRYCDIPGTDDIITNTMTGGRKRGDINFLLTNNLRAMLDCDTSCMKAIMENMSTIAVGKIKDIKVIEDFCSRKALQEIKPELMRLHKTNNTKNEAGQDMDKYSHAFCVVLDNGKRAVIKTDLPTSILNSDLFRTGVNVRKGQ